MAKPDNDKTTAETAEAPPPPAPRPWSMAAAMEPLPPLAPPVEEPLPPTARHAIATNQSRKEAKRRLKETKQRRKEAKPQKENSSSRLLPVVFVLFLVAVAVLLFLHYA